MEAVAAGGSGAGEEAGEPGAVSGRVSGLPAGTGATVLARVTAQTLNSGWKERGSTASLVTALMLRYSPNRSFQWKGAKQVPLAGPGR